MSELIYLKVKIATLAAESKIIRKQERKQVKANRKFKIWLYTSMRAVESNLERLTELKAIEAARFDPRPSLHHHRTHEVRKEARASLLAYGFLRGKAYKVMEQKCYEEPKWDKIEALATRFSSMDQRVLAQRFAEWKAIGNGLEQGNSTPGT